MANNAPCNKKRKKGHRRPECSRPRRFHAFHVLLPLPATNSATDQVCVQPPAGVPHDDDFPCLLAEAGTKECH